MSSRDVEKPLQPLMGHSPNHFQRHFQSFGHDEEGCVCQPSSMRIFSIFNWLPGIMCMHPFSSVASDRATQAATCLSSLKPQVGQILMPTDVCFRVRLLDDK